MAGVGLFLGSQLAFSRLPAAVVHEVSLQVPLTPEPDPTRLTRKDVFYERKEEKKHSKSVKLVLTKMFLVLITF